MVDRQHAITLPVFFAFSEVTLASSPEVSLEQILAPPAAMARRVTVRLRLGE
jgi:hypothetical protein